MQKQLVECAAVHAVRVCRDGGFLGQDVLSCDGWVDSEHSPVHEPAVSEIRVVGLLRYPLQDLVNDGLRGLRLWLVNEQLDGRREQRELDLAASQIFPEWTAVRGEHPPRQTPP